MTDPLRSTVTPRRGDRVWEQAMDWLLQVQATPDDPLLRQRCDAWLAADPAHAKAYRKAEKVWRLSGELARPAAAPPPPRRPLGRRLVPAAATLALAACLALLLLPGLGLHPFADHRTGTGEIRRIALADGSRVVMDARTSLDSTIATDRRTVSLWDGRAFFQVAPDPGRPFVVAAGPAVVSVTGTAFDVRARDGAVTVEVESGSVSVAAERDGRRSTAVLTRGMRARLPAADGRRGGDWVVEAVPPAQVALWRGGRLVVDGATIAQVVEEARRHFSGLILLPDQDLAGRRVTGVFDITDPRTTLRSVARIHGGTVREMGPFVLVVAAK